MGLDAYIFFKRKPSASVEDILATVFWPDGYDAQPIPPEDHRLFDGVADMDRLVEVDCDTDRYFTEGYERGPWCRLGGVLAQLLLHAGVESVWYGSDAVDTFEIPNGDPFTLDDFKRLSAHALKHEQERP
jgi:hypothetical protein